MTTPGLDVLQIKRSKGVEHYCHLTHSTCGCVYEVFGIDYFDSILSSNIYDKAFIEGLERKRNLPQKEIYIVGTPYLDYYLEQLKTLETSKSEKKTILISPTWGKRGLLSKYGFELLSILSINNEYDLIIRPHPQSINYENEMLQELRNKFKDHSNLHWDYSNNGLKSMAKADLMISDFSGIILDYKFLFSRPAISIPATLDLRGRDYVDKNINYWYMDFYYKYTNILQEDDIKNLNLTLKKLLIEAPLEKRIYEDKHNPYFGTSAIETVNAIEKISKSIEVKG